MKLGNINYNTSLYVSTFFFFSSIVQAVLLAMWRAYDFMTGMGGERGFYLSFLFLLFLYFIVYVVLERFYIAVVERRILVTNYILANLVAFLLVFLYFRFFW